LNDEGVVWGEGERINDVCFEKFCREKFKKKNKKKQKHFLM